jgi:chromosome segregation ATPase
MGDNELSLKFGIENDAAAAAVDEVNKKLEETAAEAVAATEALKGTSSAVVDGAPAAVSALSSVDQAAGHLQEHLDKLANAQGPRGMVREAAQAQVALEEYTRQAKAAGVSTEEIGKKTAAAGQAIEAGATKAAQFSRAMTEIRAQGALAANQLEALRGSGGSLTGMFESMRRTGTDTQKMFGNIGLSAAVGVMAFDAAVAAGEKVSKMLVGLVDKLSALDEKQHQAADTMDRLRNVEVQLAAGHVQLGKNLADSIKNYDLYAVATGVASAKTAAFSEYLKNIKPPQTLAEATLDVEKFAAALEGAMKRGPEAAAMFLASQKDFEAKIIQSFATLGKRVPQEWENIIKAQKEAVAAQTLLTAEGAKAAIESFAKIEAARKVADDAAGVAAVHAQGRFEAEMKRLNQENVSAEEYSRRKKELYEQESAAEQIALDKQAVADAQAAVDQAKLQETMKLSQIAFGDVAKAAENYAQDIAKGVPPSEAMAKAVDGLRTTIQNTKEALPQLNDNVETLWKHADSLNEKLGLAGKAAAGFSAQAAEMAKQTKVANDQLEKTGVLVKMLHDALPTTGTGLDKLGLGASELAVALGKLVGILPDAGTGLKIAAQGFKDITASGQDLKSLF